MISSSPRGRSRAPRGCASALSSFGDPLQLVVPEQLRAPVLQPHFEDQVLWGSPGVGPRSADRAQQSPQLGGKPSLPAHPHALAYSRLFCLHAPSVLSAPNGLPPHRKRLEQSAVGTARTSGEAPPFPFPTRN